MTAPNPPRPRLLHQGTVGLDVLAVKRALSRAGYIKWGDFTTTFGPYALVAVKAFQKDHGIVTTGLYGAETHAALERTHSKGHPAEWAFDDYSVELMHEEANLLNPEAVVRSAIVAAGFFWYAHRAAIAYREQRPFSLLRPPAVPKVWDCSAFATNCYYAGDAPDPNGRHYDGQGYTGTLMSRGKRVALAQMKPGDLIFWGYTQHGSPAFPVGSPTHVSVFTGYDGGVPMTLSNGHHPMGYYAVPSFARILPLNHYRHYAVA
jgi:hypothetical protein